MLKYPSYDYTDKDTNIRNLNNYMLDRTIKMFQYEGLPDTIPARELEKILQLAGYAFITEVKGELYALWGGLGGPLDEYYRPTKITIANPWLDFNAILDVNKDGVLIYNDDMKVGLAPMFSKYHTLMVENDITMILNSYNNRIQTLIAAGDDQSRESAEAYLQKIQDGKLGIIAEQRIFDGVTVHNSSSSVAANTAALTEFHQYLRATLMNEVGLDAQYNMKRERLTAGEVQQNDEGLYPLITNMLFNRRQGMEAVNEKYGTQAVVQFGGAWSSRNIDGDSPDPQTAQTNHDDMESGQTDDNNLSQLDSMMGQHYAAQDQQQQQAQEQAPAQEPQAQEEAPQDSGLDQKTLEKDVDELPDDKRLQVYDILFSDGDQQEKIEKIKAIIESGEDKEDDKEQEPDKEDKNESKEDESDA